VTVRSILTPSQLNALARSLLEDNFALVEVAGELSNFSRPASGHMYFALKDRHALVRCALFKPKSQWLRFKPADGQQVIARGRVTLYEPRGEYQMVVEHLEPAGEGALQRAFEELKRRLGAEGLFDASRKQPIPAWPRRIAVLTSPRGAAIHDVLSVIGRRFPLLEVELLPVPVQGDGAATQIRAMLQRADASGRYDVLLLTRGGGSLEDLQAFSDEALARAIASCTTPVVCAVGHEVDFSIAEFVADLRAPTPSAAAEALTPDCNALLSRLRALHRQVVACRHRQQQTQSQRLDQVYLRLQAQRPQARLRRDRERLLSLSARLRGVQAGRLRACQQASMQLASRLRAQHPLRRLDLLRNRLHQARARLQPLTALRLQRDARALAALARALNAVSPLATLTRGYAIVRHGDGHVVRSIGQVASGEALAVRLADGEFDARVLDTRRLPDA
jgi:exodeoxyribonuclease VII large subunit